MGITESMVRPMGIPTERTTKKGSTLEKAERFRVAHGSDRVEKTIKFQPKEPATSREDPAIPLILRKDRYQ